MRAFGGEQAPLRATPPPVYGLVNASILLSGKYADLKLWGRNLLNRHYQAFYFETMNAENLASPNSFVQSGRPITFGVDITLKF